MKNATTIAIILLASLISIKSQSQSDKTVEYSDSRPVNIFIIPKEEIIKKYFIEIENDCKKSPLFAPKDEFETVSQYQNRTKEAQLFKESLIEKYKIIYIGFLESKEKERAKLYAEKVERIKKSYQKESFTFDGIDPYDAEKEFFRVSIYGESFLLKIPISEAKSFKENLSKAILQADKQLDEEGKYFDFFNYKITHPITGSVYVLNEKKPLYLETNSIALTKGTVGIPKIISEVKFTEPSGNNILDAGESAIIEFNIKNNGTGAASMLKIIGSTPNMNIEFDKEKVLPQVFPGQSQNVLFRIKADKKISTNNCDFNFSFVEENGFQPAPVKLSFGTQAFKPPKLEFVEAGIKDKGNGNNIIENSEIIEVTALIQNKGQGKADNVKAVFKIEDDNIISTTPELRSQAIGNLEPGESKVINFSFVVNNKYNGDAKLPIILFLSENEGSYGSTNNIGLQLKQISLATSSIHIQGNYEKAKEIMEVSLSSDVDKNIPVNTSKNPNRFVLIFGNENYSKYQTSLNSESNVDFASQDAIIFSQYAEKTLGVLKENIFLNIDATSAVMKKEIQRMKGLLQYTNGNAELIFYYAGHGFPDEETRESYLIPVDISGTNVRDGISLKNLYKDLSEFSSKRITIFLDACFSGGGRNAGLLAARGVKIKPKEELIDGNIVVFSASSGEQTSLPFTEKKHGMFSYFLLKKLQESKGNISYKELSDYINSEVQLNSLKINSKIQNPQILVSEKINESWQNWIIR
jgi:hypothetical protein